MWRQWSIDKNPPLKETAAIEKDGQKTKKYVLWMTQAWAYKKN